MSTAKDDPTPALPLSGEGADSAPTQILPEKNTNSAQTPISLKGGVSPSPCQDHDLIEHENLKSDPTPALPLSGEEADSAPAQILPGKNTNSTQAPISLKGGVSPSPCQGGGWEGVTALKSETREGVKIFNKSIKTPLRRTLRKNPTEPERQLWNRIRNRQILGIKFRRQQGIGRYIVDFYCAHHSLVIELDGDSHFTDEGIAYDQVRDEFLRTLGLIVLRFTNSDVMQNIDGVLTIIITEIKNLQQHKGSF